MFPSPSRPQSPVLPVCHIVDASAAAVSVAAIAAAAVAVATAAVAAVATAAAANAAAASTHVTSKESPITGAHSVSRLKHPRLLQYSRASMYCAV
jgi:hypothetical protein